MSNVLVDDLPTAVIVDGIEYDIDSDYRAALRIMLAFEDYSLTINEQCGILLANLYKTIPNNVEHALKVGFKFLACGKDEEKTDEEPVRLYSFEQDAKFIFAAFQQTHGVDLSITKMHWWKFITLFMDLGVNTTFCWLVSLRKRVNSGKASKEELRTASELGDIFAIKQRDTRTPEEKEAEAEFMRLIGES